MDNKGQFGIGTIGYALMGAMVLLIFFLIYNPVVNALLAGVNHEMANYSTIVLLLGLVGLLLTAMFISSLWNSQMQPPRQ